MGQLTCHALCCRRGDFTLDVPALELRPGEKTALLGENGCGKTTLLQALAGLLPVEGKILYQGIRWDKMSPEERAAHMGYLPQAAELLFNLSVAELIELALPGSRLLGADAREEVLGATEMTNFQGRAYPSLSGGEKRRAMLARVFCRRAAFIFLDEPTAPLDMRHSAMFMRYASSVPATVVAAMHDLNLALRYFDRFLLMKNGRILFDRQKDALKAAELEEVYGIPLHRCGDIFVPER